jgi:hypothetical protein
LAEATAGEGPVSQSFGAWLLVAVAGVGAVAVLSLAATGDALQPSGGPRLSSRPVMNPEGFLHRSEAVYHFGEVLIEDDWDGQSDIAPPVDDEPEQPAYDFHEVLIEGDWYWEPDVNSAVNVEANSARLRGAGGRASM